MPGKVLASISLLLLGCLAAAALCELLVRWLAPQQETPRWFEEDERYAYRLKKNYHQRLTYPGAGFVMDVRTNAFGLRDREWDADLERSCTNVLLLGDSFIFGYGINVEDRFDTHLAALLEREDNRYCLFNAGVPGWGTVQETRFARDHFHIFDPDILVLAFCGNDPSDDTQFLKGEMVFKEKGLGNFPGKAWLRAHSHLYRFVLHHTTVLRRAWFINAQQAGDEAIHVDAQSAGVMNESEWERTLKLLRDFHAEFLAFKPGGNMILLATNPEDPEIRDRLRSLDNGDTLRYLDLHDAVIKLSPSDRVLPYDRHWSKEVHHIVAEELRKIIENLEQGT